MTTTPETCRCECEECLALRAAEDDPGCGATVAAFEHDGGTYEIDHLGHWFRQPVGRVRGVLRRRGSG